MDRIRKDHLLRHNLFHKFLGLVNHKASSMWLPRDGIRVSIRFDLVQNLMELDRKRRGHSPTATFYGKQTTRRLHGFTGMVAVVVDHIMARMKLGSFTGGPKSHGTVRGCKEQGTRNDQWAAEKRAQVQERWGEDSS